MIVMIWYINSFKDYQSYFMMNDLEQTAEKGEPVFRNERVLVVDDHQKWLNDATNNLEYYGCKRENIFWAYNIKGGEKIYYAKNPSMTMIDINFNEHYLKDTQGLDLISTIRKDNGHIIIAAMSSLKDIEQKALDSGVNYFINKKRFIEDFDGFAKWYKQK